MTLYILLWITLLLGHTKGNYLCVCNYNVEQAVLPYPDTDARPLGYLYEFDCKSIVDVTDINNQEWRAVAYLGQIAYIEANSNIQETMCPGFVSKEDIITTIPPQGQTLSTRMVRIPSKDDFSTSTSRYRSTTVPIVTTLHISVPRETSSQSLTDQNWNFINNTIRTTRIPGSSSDLKQTPNTTTQSLKRLFTTLSRNSMTNSLSTPSTVINPNLSGALTHSKTTTPYSSTRLASGQTNSTDMLIYQTRTNGLRTPVNTTLKPTKGFTRSTPSSNKPNTIDLLASNSSTTRMISESTSKPSKTTFTKIYTLPTTYAPTIPPIIGDITVCPPILLQYTREDEGALTQYGNKCFELVPFKLIWTKAELDCRAKGGHLITVQTQEFRNYIYNWIRKFTSIPAVWLGISDRQENSWFEWTSGEKLVSTLWLHESAFTNRHDDCGIMLLDEKSKGGWQSVKCGNTTPSGDEGSQYAFICEFSISPHSLSAGVIGR